jgi:hypothetical protein
MGEQAELTNRPDVLIGKPESTNVLAMVTSDTKISFYSLGIYGVGSGVLDPLLAKSGGIGDGTVEVALGPNLSTAIVCVLPESGELQTYPVDIPLLATQPAEVHCIAAQWAHISGLLRYSIYPRPGPSTFVVLDLINHADLHCCPLFSSPLLTLSHPLNSRQVSGCRDDSDEVGLGIHPH